MNQPTWISGQQAAKALGFSNVKAILHLPIKHMAVPAKNGRTNYRYDLTDVQRYQQSITHSA